MTKSLVEKAESKGWTVKAGTLQARGLWHAFRNEAKTDDDVTVWCSTKEEAAEEALKMSKRRYTTEELLKGSDKLPFLYEGTEGALSGPAIGKEIGK